jgi:hypothetical protein
MTMQSRLLSQPYLIPMADSEQQHELPTSCSRREGSLWQSPQARHLPLQDCNPRAQRRPGQDRFVARNRRHLPAAQSTGRQYKRISARAEGFWTLRLTPYISGHAESARSIRRPRTGRIVPSRRSRDQRAHRGDNLRIRKRGAMGSNRLLREGLHGSHLRRIHPRTHKLQIQSRIHTGTHLILSLIIKNCTEES